METHSARPNITGPNTMNYRIARNGEIYGPYTEADVRRYLLSGHIVASDLVQPEGGVEWVSVGQQFPAGPAPAMRFPAAPASTHFGANMPVDAVTHYPDPPNLPWWIALVLGAITGGVFLVVWDIVQAAWVRRVQPASNALFFYIALAVVYLLRLPSNWGTISYNLFAGPPVRPHHGFLLFLAWLVLFIAARAAIRQDLLQHFNGPEPVGLRLNPVFVYVFGGIYIQYHFNRIIEWKRAQQMNVPAY